MPSPLLVVQVALATTARRPTGAVCCIGSAENDIRVIHREHRGVVGLPEDESPMDVRGCPRSYANWFAGAPCRAGDSSTGSPHSARSMPRWVAISDIQPPGSTSARPRPIAQGSSTYFFSTESAEEPATWASSFFASGFFCPAASVMRRSSRLHHCCWGCLQGVDETLLGCGIVPEVPVTTPARTMRRPCPRSCSLFLSRTSLSISFASSAAICPRLERLLEGGERVVGPEFEFVRNRLVGLHEEVVGLTDPV